MRWLRVVLTGSWPNQEQGLVFNQVEEGALPAQRGDVAAWPSIGLLGVRLIAGGAMLLHGAPKMMAATSWMGPGGIPGWLQALAAVAEFGGGLAWIVGALTPLASLGVVATMTTGIFMAHVPAGEPLIRLTVKGAAQGPSGTFMGLPPWLVQTDGAIAGGSGSSELALLFIAIALTLTLVGPGRYAVDALWLRRRKR
jgi:putative oxidoreductase